MTLSSAIWHGVLEETSSPTILDYRLIIISEATRLKFFDVKRNAATAPLTATRPYLIISRLNI